MKRLTERQKQVLQAALAYAFANCDGINDAFANVTDDDPDNEAGEVLLYPGVTAPSFTADEFEEVAKTMGLPPINF
jgi:hypothetical protein